MCFIINSIGCAPVEPSLLVFFYREHLVLICLIHLENLGFILCDIAI